MTTTWEHRILLIAAGILVAIFSIKLWDRFVAHPTPAQIDNTIQIKNNRFQDSLSAIVTRQDTSIKYLLKWKQGHKESVIQINKNATNEIKKIDLFVDSDLKRTNDSLERTAINK